MPNHSVDCPFLDPATVVSGQFGGQTVQFSGCVWGPVEVVSALRIPRHSRLTCPVSPGPSRRFQLAVGPTGTTLPISRITGQMARCKWGASSGKNNPLPVRLPLHEDNQAA